MRRIWPLILLTAVAAFGILYRLDDTYLWQDEAETAILAYNTLQNGYPVTVDEYGNVVLEGGHETNEEGVWIWQTWGQYYLGAASFALFGEKSTLAARFPFALLGIACIPLTWLLAMKLFDNRRIALLAAVFVTASVPFVLFARQCRNYTLATVATLLVLLGYVRFVRKESPWGVGLGAALVMLYYSQILLFAAVMVGMMVHYFIFNREWGELGRIVPMLASVLLLTIPWFVYSGAFDRPGQFSPGSFAPNLLKFVLWINNYLFPLLLLIVPVLALRARRARRDGERLFVLHNPVVLLAIFIGVGVLVWSLVFWVFFRYLVIYIPLFAILLALAVDWIYARAKFPGVAVAGLLALTNVLSLPPVWLARPFVSSALSTIIDIPGVGGQVADRYDSAEDVLHRRVAPDSMLLEFAGELIHGYDGPIEAISSYLNEHASGDETVWVNYEELPLLFYNRKGYTIHSYYKTAEDERLELLRSADWVVSRHIREQVSLKGSTYRTAPAPFDLKFTQAVAGRFVAADDFGIVYDRKHESRPSPDLHAFASPASGPELVIYRRASARGATSAAR